MIDTARSRLAVIVVLSLLLFVLLVAAGTVTPADDPTRYPSVDEFAADYGAYVGETVEFGGIVVGTDPVVVEARPDVGEPIALTVEDVDEPVDVGDSVGVLGELREDGTVVATGVVVHERAGRSYMFAVSFLAGLWVLGRFLAGWRLRLRRLAFEPRDASPASGRFGGE